MELNSKNVRIRDEAFEVRELTVKQLLPLMKGMQEGGLEEQVPLIAASVHQDGKPLGDTINDLPASVYMKLLPYVMEVNNMKAQGDESGNG